MSTPATKPATSGQMNVVNKSVATAPLPLPASKPYTSLNLSDEVHLLQDTIIQLQASPDIVSPRDQVTINKIQLIVEDIVSKLHLPVSHYPAISLVK